ncbi:beta strand repeat-containing protein [Adhaeretor mobilis]|uniref:PEP-CTERM protein-sorting domain-containing protein n=1 Tax=Adhaeretor mobilis TaxID=1930276 RepID=A0A517N371_9BACT|nr:PEP-CTERM sorting domain-containing protein [Adhaeretor mobilis]QDT01581.1 hypothetical protein HG15A2_49280 [Adhaeretor mobilis]
MRYQFSWDTFVRALLGFVLLLFLNQQASAEDRFWIATTGGPFGNASSWSATSGGAGGASAPKAGIDTIFDQSATYTVTVGEDIASDSLTLSAGDVTFETDAGAVSAFDYTIGGGLSVHGGTLIVADSASTHDVNTDISGNLFVAGGAAVELQGGATTSGSASIGNSTFSVATIEVQGADASWMVSGNLDLNFGGTLNVTNGAHVTSQSSTMFVPGGAFAVQASASISGNDSTWTTGDQLQAGIIDVFNGGLLESRSAAINGAVTVDSTGGTAQWDNQTAITFTPGIAGASLSIVGGGIVTTGSTSMNASNGSASSASIDGAGSAWNHTGNLDIGGTGSNVLQILNGGVVTNATGLAAGGSTTTLSGNDSRWTNSAGLTVGTTSAAPVSDRVTINSGAVVEVAGAMTLENTGLIELSGGTLKFDASSSSVSGQFVMTSGTLHLTDAAGYSFGSSGNVVDQTFGGAQAFVPAGMSLVVDNTLTVPVGAELTSLQGEFTGQAISNAGLINGNGITLSSTAGLDNTGDLVLINSTVNGPVSNSAGSSTTVVGTVDFNGTISGPGNFFGPGTANFNGGLAIGASPAEVNFEGNVALAAANTLFIEIGGLLAGDEFDRLTIEGAATLDGTLDVELISGFTPAGGDTFEILTADAGISGVFSLEALPALDTGMEWNVTYGANNVILEVLAVLAADTEPDGDVDGADFLALQRDNPGLIPTWQTEYGSGTSLLAATQQVPEPTTLSLFLLGLVTISCLRRTARF